MTTYETTRTFVRLLFVAAAGLTIGAASQLAVGGSNAVAAAGAAQATLTHLADGDSFHVDIAGAADEVRLIGIDTPEIGSCEATAAKTYLDRLLSGTTIILVPGAQNDRDRYDRILRYAHVAVDPADDIDGTADGMLDVGAAAIASGYGIARYDSRDGYGPHVREGTYIALDDMSPPYRCSAADEPVLYAEAEPAPEPWQPPADEEPADDNPYDDGGPRRPDGSCPPGGCTPDNPNPDLNNNPYDDGGPRRADGSCPPGGCR